MIIKVVTARAVSIVGERQGALRCVHALARSRLRASAARELAAVGTAHFGGALICDGLNAAHAHRLLARGARTGARVLAVQGGSPLAFRIGPFSTSQGASRALRAMDALFHSEVEQVALARLVEDIPDDAEAEVDDGLEVLVGLELAQDL